MNKYNQNRKLLDDNLPRSNFSIISSIIVLKRIRVNVVDEQKIFVNILLLNVCLDIVKHVSIIWKILIRMCFCIAFYYVLRRRDNKTEKQREWNNIKLGIIAENEHVNLLNYKMLNNM